MEVRPAPVHQCQMFSSLRVPSCLIIARRTVGSAHAPLTFKCSAWRGAGPRQGFELVLHTRTLTLHTHTHARTSPSSITPQRPPSGLRVPLAKGGHDPRPIMGVQSGGGLRVYMCVYTTCNLSFPGRRGLEGALHLKVQPGSRAHPSSLQRESPPPPAPGPVPLAPALLSVRCHHYRCPREPRGLKLGHAGTDNDKVETLQT